MMSVIITHPVDQTKIRSQTQEIRYGMLTTARNTIRASGVLGLWTGLSGSLVRQATYGSSRFGIYAWLKERDDRARGVGGSMLAGGGIENRTASRWGLVKNGALAGIVAGIVGAPAGKSERYHNEQKGTTLFPLVSLSYHGRWLMNLKN